VDWDTCEQPSGVHAVPQQTHPGIKISGVLPDPFPLLVILVIGVRSVNGDGWHPFI
jgi:hypothetical protein